MRIIAEGLAVLIGRASLLALFTSCGALPFLLPEVVPMTEEVVKVVEDIEAYESKSNPPALSAKPVTPAKPVKK
jgi:hypothetical protein